MHFKTASITSNAEPETDVDSFRLREVALVLIKMLRKTSIFPIEIVVNTTITMIFPASIS